MAIRKITFFLILLISTAAVPVRAEPVSIIAVGDLLLGGSASERVKKKGFLYPFSATRRYLIDADIAMANLEAPLTRRGEKHPDKKYTFRVPPKAAADIRRAGFDLMTLANNHIGDYGEQGVLDTLETLEKHDLGISGAGRTLKEARTPHVVEVDGRTFAFLSYSNTFPKSFYAGKEKPGTAPGYFEYVAADIRKARKTSDHIIVSFHWGGERMNAPKDYQKELGRMAINNGADVVIGHHPHVLQGAERYKDGIIYYSLGNFAFGSYSKAAVTAGMARIWFDDGQLIKAEILPLNVFNIDVHFQPKPLVQGPAYAFVRDFNEYSEPFNTRLKRQPGPFWEIEKVEPKEDDILLATETQGHGEVKN